MREIVDSWIVSTNLFDTNVVNTIETTSNMADK